MKTMKSILGILIIFSLTACGDDKNGQSDPSPTGDELSASEESALNEALQDEYRARFTYLSAAEKFSNSPFSNIAQAELTHINELHVLYTTRGLTAPPSQWDADNVPTYSTLQAACAAAVSGELQNIAMYDRLFHQDLAADVVATFQRLRRASEEQHLPAFSMCD